MPVLACDGIHQDGLALFREAGWDVVVSDPIKDPAALAVALTDVDAVLVRSATAVPAEALTEAKRLRVIVPLCCMKNVPLRPSSAADSRSTAT